MFRVSLFIEDPSRRLLPPFRYVTGTAEGTNIIRLLLKMALRSALLRLSHSTSLTGRPPQVHLMKKGIFSLSVLSASASTSASMPLSSGGGGGASARKPRRRRDP